jgi:3-mercaptopyruvate sulfurtransferase SseA
MKQFMAALSFFTLALCATSSPAQQQPRYPVDPQTRWATGAKLKPAEQLKKQRDSGSTVMIIDVRSAASFEKETIPGAINVPFAELEGHLKTLPKDTFIVFT